jgi:hypothetical protein
VSRGFGAVRVLGSTRLVGPDRADKGHVLLDAGAGVLHLSDGRLEDSP